MEAFQDGGGQAWGVYFVDLFGGEPEVEAGAEVAAGFDADAACLVDIQTQHFEEHGIGGLAAIADDDYDDAALAADFQGAAGTQVHGPIRIQPAPTDNFAVAEVQNPGRWC